MSSNNGDRSLPCLYPSFPINDIILFKAITLNRLCWYILDIYFLLTCSILLISSSSTLPSWYPYLILDFLIHVALLYLFDHLTKYLPLCSCNTWWLYISSFLSWPFDTSFLSMSLFIKSYSRLLIAPSVISFFFLLQIYFCWSFFYVFVYFLWCVDCPFHPYFTIISFKTFTHSL